MLGSDGSVDSMRFFPKPLTRRVKPGGEYGSWLMRSHVLSALGIPNGTACSSGEDDGKRMVVMGSVGVFGVYGLFGRGSVIFGGIRGPCWVERGRGCFQCGPIGSAIRMVVCLKRIGRWHVERVWVFFK